MTNNVITKDQLMRQIVEENVSLRMRVSKLEEALHKIADMDYRGNRSTESSIAFKALETK